LLHKKRALEKQVQLSRLPKVVLASSWGWLLPKWNPNPVGIKDLAGFPIEAAIDFINNLHTGEIQEERQVTDPVVWPTNTTSGKVAIRPDAGSPIWTGG